VLSSTVDQTEEGLMIESKRFTSGRIAVANLSASIASLERRRAEGTRFEDLVRLSEYLFVRGELRGRISDHDRAERVAAEAMASSQDAPSALYVRARLARHFHRFADAGALLDRALTSGHPRHQIDAERAALLQATGRFVEALAVRERLAKEDPGIPTLGALGSLLAQMDRWARAEMSYTAALESAWGVSPLPVGQVLCAWGVSAMRRGELIRAEKLFGELHAILPEHVPGRGHRAEVALARGQLDGALQLIGPVIGASDDPAWRAVHAEILAASGERADAAREADRAAAAYEALLARRPEAYADSAAAFFLGIGNRPLRAVELASLDCNLRDTPSSRNLLTRARRGAEQVA
jgi:tetratricopeptide (TPR) repeat protein